MAEGFLEWLTALPAGPTYAVLMALAAIENVFPPVPADVAVALGAFLAQRGEISAVLIGVLCWLANTVSAAAMYVLGRTHGEVFFRRGWGQRLVPPAALSAVEQAFVRHGVWGIFVSRLLPGFRAAVTPAAGIVGMPPGRTLIPAALASAVWYTFLIIVGSTLGLSWDAIERVLARVNSTLALIAAFGAVLLCLWLWQRRGSR